jgi:hypothetical protein
MKLISLLPVLAVLAAGCAPKPASVNTALASAPPTAAINGTADCAADGLAPGSQAYKDCVSALNEASADAGNMTDMSAQMQTNATQMRAQMQAQMDQQRAQMRQQMQQDMNAAQNPSSGCTTTRDANNNVSTSCP